MLVVGLTGGIASGKSTVSTLLSSKHHVQVIDLDVLARQVVEPNDPSRTLDHLVAYFGRSILQSDGTLDRPALGRMAFGEGNEAARRKLNAITHGAIRKRMMWNLVVSWFKGAKVTVVDTPLLVEAGLWKWCGQAAVVWCSPEDQLSRMVKRDQRHGLTEEDARHRLSSQLPLRKKLPYADVVLDNSSAVSGSDINGSSDSGDQPKTSEALDAQVADLVRSWRGSYGGFFGTLWWLAQWLCPPFGLLTAALCVMSRRKAVDTRLREAEESDRQADERRSLGSQ